MVASGLAVFQRFVDTPIGGCPSTDGLRLPSAPALRPRRSKIAPSRRKFGGKNTARRYTLCMRDRDGRPHEELGSCRPPDACPPSVARNLLPVGGARCARRWRPSGGQADAARRSSPVVGCPALRGGGPWHLVNVSCRSMRRTLPHPAANENRPPMVMEPSAGHFFCTSRLCHFGGTPLLHVVPLGKLVGFRA